MRCATILCTLVLTLGCSTMGKTTSTTGFVDADGTNYTREISLPGGVTYDGQDKMSYEWDGLGGGKISIGREDTSDTTLQAQMLTAMFEAQTTLMSNMFSGLFALVTGLAPEAAPLIAQKLDLDAVDSARDDARSDARFNALMERLMALEDRLGVEKGGSAE